MSVTALVGGQWGSEGKGVVAARIASRFDAAVRVGGPNAGHSFKHIGGESPQCSDTLHKHVMRGVPCQWIEPGSALFIGPGAVVDYSLLTAEAEDLDLKIHIDPGAVLVPQWAHDEERSGLVQRIGSTGEGVGVARRLRIERDPDKVEFAGDVRWPGRFWVVDVAQALHQMIEDGNQVLLEGTQGSGLSLLHGAWPYVTSADTNAAQMLVDAGIAPSNLEHTLLVARTYPIRVAGPSGPMGVEVGWDDIPGAPTPEKTTVTKKQRRIAKWSDEVFSRAVLLNDPCGVVLTFADYVDPAVAGVDDWDRLMESEPVAAFVDRLVDEFGVPVVGVGTGGDSWAIAPGGPCRHNEQWF